MVDDFMLAIFMDGGHLDAMGKRCGVWIDHYQLLRLILRNVHRATRLYGIFYYDCDPYQHDPPTAEERRRLSQKQKFTDFVKDRLNYQVRYGRLVHRFGEKGEPYEEQKLVDVSLVNHLTTT